MQTPLISVVMAVYNGGPYLAASIESILNQTWRDFELIVVDDGSTDASWAILTDYAARDERIVALRNPANAGVVRSLNTGLQKARGRIIARQDADDISAPARFQAQLDYLGSHNDYGLVAAVPQLIDPEGHPLDQTGRDATENEEIQSKLLDHMCLCGATIMVRRESLEAAGFFFSDGLNASEDYDICLRLAEVTKVASLRGGLYLYRQLPQSASRTQEQRQALNKAIALERAIYRRYGAAPAVQKLAPVGRDYLRAALIGAARCDLDAARHSLRRAVEVYPPLFSDKALVEGLVKSYTPLGQVENALQYTDAVFRELLPATPGYRRLRDRLASNLHMGEAFAAAGRGQYALARVHLWQGLRRAPGWLLNRGVVVIGVKALFARNSHTPGAGRHNRVDSGAGA